MPVSGLSLLSAGHPEKATPRRSFSMGTMNDRVGWGIALLPRNSLAAVQSTLVKEVEAISKFVRPKNLPELESNLGLMNIYRSFVFNVTTILSPLHDIKPL